MYLDLETTSGYDDVDSLNPWVNCEILGAAFTWDDNPDAYYLPMRQRNILDLDANLPHAECHKFLQKLIDQSEEWINPNVKYDAHVITNSAGVDCSSIVFIDVTVLAKLVDSDRFRYALEYLVKDYLYKDIIPYKNNLRPYLFHPGGKRKCQDYGVISLREMVPYACQDVLSGRELYKALILELHEDCFPVWETEKQITRVLYDIEQEGIELNIELLTEDYLKFRRRLAAIKFEIRELTGFMIEPNKNEDCYDLFHGHYGYPVLEETEKGQPSYNKAALKGLRTIPGAPLKVLDLVQEFRDKFKIFTSFIIPYIVRCSKTKPAKLHCTFNQVVRTGRMSCSEPNLQQLPSYVKIYAVPGKDRSFIEFDLKQIEYRFIAHYTKNPRILKEYQTNPAADFHDTMKDMCNITRDPAKAMNFAVSFGAGKGKTVTMLKAAFDLSNVPEGTNLDEYATEKGAEVYETYHRQFPELKTTFWRASRTLQQLGYVKNLFGRIRKLPRKLHYRSFNNVVQSGAADFMKLATVRVHERTKGTEAKLLCLVHDSWLFSVPTSEVDYWTQEIKTCIEETPSNLCVPVYASFGDSSEHWKGCDDK